MVPDTVDGFVGPLAGVLAGMRWSAAHAPGRAGSRPRPATRRCCRTTRGPAAPAAIEGRTNAIALAQSNGDLHPVIGLWPVALADDLEEQLRAGVRKVLAWTDRHGTAAVAFPPERLGDASIDPFFNANTPEELDGLRAMLARAAP